MVSQMNSTQVFWISFPSASFTLVNTLEYSDGCSIPTASLPKRVSYGSGLFNSINLGIGLQFIHYIELSHNYNKGKPNHLEV